MTPMLELKYSLLSDQYGKVSLTYAWLHRQNLFLTLSLRIDQNFARWLPVHLRDMNLLHILSPSIEAKFREG